MAYAQVSDVQVLNVDELSTEEQAFVAKRLDQVERIILRRIPDLDARVSADAGYEQDVITVEADAVLRALQSREGLTLETDGNYTYQKTASAADSRLRILPEEWDTLGLAPTGAKVFVIRQKLNLPWEA